MIGRSIANDWQLFDGLQTISYTSRIDDGDFASPISGQALKREDDKDYGTDSLGGELARHRANWRIWVTSMASSVVPKRGDEFTATTVSGSNSWLVEAADYCDFTSSFRLHCKQVNNNG